jgi:hypothetical protein
MNRERNSAASAWPLGPADTWSERPTHGQWPCMHNPCLTEVARRQLMRHGIDRTRFILGNPIRGGLRTPLACIDQPVDQGAGSQAVGEAAQAEYNICSAAPAVGLGICNDQLSHAHMHWTSKRGSPHGTTLAGQRSNQHRRFQPPRANSYPFFAWRHAKFLLFLQASC